MADEEKQETGAEKPATGSDEAAADAAAEDAEDSDEGEDASTPPAEDGILRDPRTGKPLRDQTPAAADNGYLGNHDMRDQTERQGNVSGAQDGAPREGVDEDDFGEGEEPLIKE